MRFFNTSACELLPANGPHVAFVAEVAMLGFVTTFASAAADHFSKKLGIAPSKTPGDLDLLMDKAAFFDAFWMLAPNSRRLVPGKYVELTSGDGARLSLLADEITGWPHDSREGPEIQIMRPLAPVRCEMPDGTTHFYDTTFDEGLAAYNIQDGSLPYLHPRAAAMFYAMYQRPSPKQDAHNALILNTASEGMVSSGAVQKLMEARGFDAPRVQGMLLGLGSAAATPMRTQFAVAA